MFVQGTAPEPRAFAGLREVLAAATGPDALTLVIERALLYCRIQLGAAHVALAPADAPLGDHGRAVAFPLGNDPAAGKLVIESANALSLTAWQRELAAAVASLVGFALASSERERTVLAQRDELELFLRYVGDGITVHDAANRLIYANARAAAMLGVPHGELTGSTVERVLARFELLDEHGHPLSIDRLPSRVARVEQREARGIVLLRQRGGSTAEDRRALIVSVPVFGAGGELEMVVNTLRDITEEMRAQARAQRAATRVARLLQVTAALQEANSTEQVGNTAVVHGCAALGAQGGVFYLRDFERDEIELVASHGYARELVDPFRRLAVDADTPINNAMRRGEIVLLRDLAERDRAYPEMADINRRTGHLGSLVSVPIGKVGAIGFSFERVCDFLGEDSEFLLALSAQCCQALERARLYEGERHARAVAEAMQKRNEFMAAASAVLGSSLDYQATLAQVTQIAVPAIADWCAVDLRGEGETVHQVAVHHADPARRQWALQVRRRFPVDWAAPRGVGMVIRTGEPVMLSEITESFLREFDRPREHIEELLALGLRSAIIAPISSGGRTLGAITLLHAESQRRYDEEDLRIAVELGKRAGVAIENAQLYSAEREARALANAAEQRKDEFLAILGHELRNPLAPIVTALEIMQLGPEGPCPYTREREIIGRQVKYVQRLVDDLLDFSRISRGKLELRNELCELADIAGDAVEVAAPLLEERRHQLTVTAPAHGLTVWGDRVRLAQVVANLLTNAAKYTPPGGKISLTAEAQRDRAVLAVSDNGVGIEPSLMPTLFGLFVQGRQTECSLGSGLGLGLTVVKRLVEIHGGEVRVQSAGPGQGSRFEVRLPLRARADAEVRPALHQRAVAPGRELRILIVDDNEDAADMLAIALKALGHNTRVAGDGPSALVTASRWKPDVALLDIGLPVMDGYELAQRLRDEYGGLRLIAVTGYGQKHDRERALRAGFDAHFVKPISLREVVDEATRLQ